jgi:hypothetical protein
MDGIFDQVRVNFHPEHDSVGQFSIAVVVVEIPKCGTPFDVVNLSENPPPRYGFRLGSG